MCLQLAVLLTVLLAIFANACEFGGGPKMAMEKRIVLAPIAVKALVTSIHQDNDVKVKKKSSFVAQLWLLDVFKGEDKLAAALGLPGHGADAVFHLKDQRVNVSHWGDSSRCWSNLQPQKTYVVLLEPNYEKSGVPFKARYDDPFGALIDYSQETERKLLKALGWNPWSEWSPCSRSCGGGQQERTRTCTLEAQRQKRGRRCPSYNGEKRTCNSFACSGAVNTLSVNQDRYYKPSPSAFHHVDGRGEDTWLIRPGSYFLLPFQEAYGRHFPQDFTIFLTLKPTEASEGIIFSLNARNAKQEYISLELNEGHLELVHSLSNGSKIIDIPAKISDGNWHQLAISIHGGSSVRTYLDCHWITTQILHRHSLNVPKDTDVIVGYMFQGELEQLTVVDESSGGVSEQCSPTRVPFDRDEQEDNNSKTKDINRKEEKSDIHILEDKEDHAQKEESSNDYLEEEYVDLDWVESPSLQQQQQRNNSSDIKPSGGENTHSTVTLEGSGGASSDDDEDEGSGGLLAEERGSGDFELEWSSWSGCSTSCGKWGRQSRTSRCVDNGFLEECVAATKKDERHDERHASKQTRPCNRRPCFASGWIPVEKKSRFETVTDVDRSRHHSGRSWTEKPTHVEEPEEHTNAIPHIPNYWAPQIKLKHHQPTPMYECWCANGGTCISKRLEKQSKCKCRKGYVGKHCERATCRPGCANGGRCVDPDVCACPDGYTGARCQTAFCHPGCQNGGSCVAPFKCACPVGVTGAFCEDFSCRPRCANGGVCIGHNLCSCPHGFSGPECRDKTCTTHCENGGVCTMPGNQCKCPPGVYGARCHKRLCLRYVAVRKPHQRNFKHVVTVEYDSVCKDDLSHEEHPCKKTRPEYRTVHKTVYKTAYKCAERPWKKEQQNQQQQQQQQLTKKT